MKLISVILLAVVGLCVSAQAQAPIQRNFFTTNTPVADAAAARSLIGAGQGSVTSVGITVSPGAGFAAVGPPVTSNGNLSITFTSQTANKAWMGPVSGAAAAPAFRILATNDVPDLSGFYVRKNEPNVVSITNTSNHFGAQNMVFVNTNIYAGTGTLTTAVGAHLWTNATGFNGLEVGNYLLVGAFQVSVDDIVSSTVIRTFEVANANYNTSTWNYYSNYMTFWDSAGRKVGFIDGGGGVWLLGQEIANAARYWFGSGANTWSLNTSQNLGGLGPAFGLTFEGGNPVNIYRDAHYDSFDVLPNSWISHYAGITNIFNTGLDIAEPVRIWGGLSSSNLVVTNLITANTITADILGANLSASIAGTLTVVSNAIFNLGVAVIGAQTNTLPITSPVTTTFTAHDSTTNFYVNFNVPITKVTPGVAVNFVGSTNAPAANNYRIVSFQFKGSGSAFPLTFGNTNWTVVGANTATNVTLGNSNGWWTVSIDTTGGTNDNAISYTVVPPLR